MLDNTPNKEEINKEQIVAREGKDKEQLGTRQIVTRGTDCNTWLVKKEAGPLIPNMSDGGALNDRVMYVNVIRLYSECMYIKVIKVKDNIGHKMLRMKGTNYFYYKTIRMLAPENYRKLHF